MSGSTYSVSRRAACLEIRREYASRHRVLRVRTRPTLRDSVVRPTFDPLAQGSALFALGIVLLGVLNLVSGDFLAPLQPMPNEVAARPLWAFAHGGLLVALAAGLMIDHIARPAAMALTVLLLSWLLLAHIPALLAQPGNVSTRVAAAELLAMTSVAWMLANFQPNGISSVAPPKLAKHSQLVGRVCFGLMLLVFGATHLAHSAAIAKLIPAWIPGRELWPWFTGIANLVAGMSLLMQIKARLAALLAGSMFGSWIFLVHIERLAADVTDISEWSFAAMAIALTGAAWIVAAGCDDHQRQ